MSHHVGNMWLLCDRAIFSVSSNDICASLRRGLSVISRITAFLSLFPILQQPFFFNEPCIVFLYQNPMTSVTARVCYHVLSRVLFLLLLGVGTALSQNLSDVQLSIVSARLAEGAKARSELFNTLSSQTYLISCSSWELGTRSQAILSLNGTAFSVLSPSTPLPPPSSVPTSLSSALQPFFDIARTVVAGRAASNNNATGPQALIQDSSAADPASIGVAVLLANWTGQGGEDYAGAAKDQLDYLQFQVPRTSDGAISHRTSQVQLW
jgi:hypothetical protein